LAILRGNVPPGLPLLEQEMNVKPQGQQNFMRGTGYDNGVFMNSPPHLLTSQ
jgi:hypothetical protein